MAAGPFRFAPAAGVQEGPAFSPAFRLLASAIVFGCAGWMFSLWPAGSLGAGGRSGIGWFGAALVLMGWTWIAILRSRTRVDAAAVSQRWIWHKRLELGDLAYAKVLRVRGLEWLVAPRLYLRTFSGRFAVFYAADAALLAEFDRLAAELRAWRLGDLEGYRPAAGD
ncbi:hypothetical protein [Xylophilus sp.]|uniref:hypothetical protein n=1 Tax=Xylophilus sp. TaxID=2653893 RepID=UPI0013B859B9|nr:hypothetical protein [Xylophilus sp.]KAF1045257.1 MAG: hypothetical protein GAK38_03095 [Xylophilus sp.]